MTSLKKTKFLQGILEFEKFAHRGLTVVNVFIFEYILSWDGMEYARVIYELFEYLSFTSEEGCIYLKYISNVCSVYLLVITYIYLFYLELKVKFLENLYSILITGNELIYRMVINSLTNLLCNLVSLKITYICLYFSFIYWTKL